MDIKTDVIDFLKETLEIEEINPSSRFMEDLGMNSISMLEFIFAYEKRLDASIPLNELIGVKTVADFIAAAERSYHAR